MSSTPAVYEVSRRTSCGWRGGIDDGVFHGGRRVWELEAVAGERWGGHAVATSSGTMALECAVRALGIGAGDEVIVPALTFVSTAFAVAAVGAVPVFVDFDPHTRTIDPAAAAAVTPRTRGVIPVHMHGLMADMTAVTALAGHHGLAVIEDCAQAAGATDAGRPAGSVGDVGCYSMWVGKNLGGLADGGLLLARDPALVRRCCASSPTWAVTASATPTTCAAAGGGWGRSTPPSSATSSGRPHT
ncbi:DegT/DnrJ/EryC1/StrS family aminotransferase [Streptomyces erythrochromogenes]|uniref:DegT/DnrJ/EryC1/StrS family aminotransferase n=1 Tax=Streptomyces erythrochromogenes TaxID=285574 RepID=UPI003801FEF8